MKKTSAVAEIFSVKPKYILGIDSGNTISHKAIFLRPRLIVIC